MIFFDAGHSSWSIISFSDFDSDAIEPTGSDWLTANIHVIAEYIYWETIRELDKEVYFPEGRQPIFLDQLHRYLTLQPSAEGAPESILPFYNVSVGSYGDIEIYPTHWEKAKEGGDAAPLEGFCFKPRTEAQCGPASCNDRSTVHLPSNSNDSFGGSISGP